MSRIGKKPITLPTGVSMSVAEGNLVTVKGPKGELKEQINPDMIIAVEGSQVKVSRPTEQKRHKSLHGLSRTLLSNMVVGVTDGYTKELELIGVGYKAEAVGQALELNLGYSHLIMMVLPKEVAVTTETKKGAAPKITLTGIDKQLVGHMAAKIRGMRPPEPYKGKGIRYVGEVIRRKAGKSAKK